MRKRNCALLTLRVAAGHRPNVTRISRASSPGGMLFTGICGMGRCLRKPRRGGMFIDRAPYAQFFLFFSGAAPRGSYGRGPLIACGRQSEPCITVAPLKNKKKILHWLGVYKHATPTGFSEAPRLEN